MPFPIGTECLSPAVFEILQGIKLSGITTLICQSHVTSSVTWPFDPKYSFPIGAALQPSLYPADVEIMGSKYIEIMTLTFVVNGHKWSRDAICHFVLVIQWNHWRTNLYLQPFLRYIALSILGHYLDLSGLRDFTGHIRLAVGQFLLVVLWNQNPHSRNFLGKS